LLPAAVLIIVAETSATVATVVPGSRPYGLIALSVLLGTFSAAVAINIARGRTTISCACFGKSSKSLSPSLVWRNGALLVAAVFSAAASGADRAWPTSGAASLVVLVAVAGWLLVEAADALGSGREAVG
jgi:hypothetical protein